MSAKILHGCWFGGELTPLARRCLASWRHFAPDYEIRLHHEIPDCAFARAAAAKRKWAMVSDCARMQALYDEGGIYFDLDVELLRPLELTGEWVAGERTATGREWMNPGSGLALERHSPIAKHMLEAYAALEFDPHREMMEWINARLAECAGGLKVLPSEVFSPIGVDGRLRRTAATIGIHHYAMSWASPKQRLLRFLSHHGMRPLVDRALRLRDAWGLGS